MKKNAEIVIIGAGIAGASIAYHLAALGRRNVVVVEQGELISGTTSHAPGLVGQLRASKSLARMLMYSVSLYRTLHVNGVPGFVGEGSIRLAASPARFMQLQQQAAFAYDMGLEPVCTSAISARDHFPLLDPSHINGVLYIPGDGSAVATILAQALIDGARAGGVTFYSHLPVTRIDKLNGRILAVETPGGRIEADTVVVAAGIWSSRIGALAGAAIPLTPMRHQYVITEPLAELAGRTAANLRDPDRLIYLRQREQALVIGGYERAAQPFDVDAIPQGDNPTVVEFDEDAFAPLLQAATERVPALRGIGIARRVCGLEAFTPDGEFLLGPVADVPGLWTACGFCAHGVSGAGGVGKVMAEWIVKGDPGLDVSAMDVRRFAGRSLDKRAIQEAASKVYSTYYDITE